MTVNNQLVVLFSAAAANGTSAVADFGGLTDDVTLEIETTGSPTFSLQLQGSIDYDHDSPSGADWVNIGSAVVAVGVTKVSFSTVGPMRFFRATLASLSGGTFTAKLAAVPGI